jgi:hypothetical protein
MPPGSFGFRGFSFARHNSIFKYGRGFQSRMVTAAKLYSRFSSKLHKLANGKNCMYVHEIKSFL